VSTAVMAGTPTVRVERWKDGRAWAVYDEWGELVCVALYRRGADEVARRLTALYRPAPMVREESPDPW